MHKHTLDFSHAYEGRMTVAKELCPQACASGSNTEASTVARGFVEELAQGELPFCDYSFVNELKAELPAVLERIAFARHMIVLGIGGSALGARALQKAFAPQQDRPTASDDKGHRCLWIADNIDTPTLEQWMSSLHPAETVIAIVSKSGGTIETFAQYLLLKNWLQGRIGDGWTRHCIIVTGKGTGSLWHEAREHGIQTLPVPEHLGGRYSVISAVGMLPAAFLGIDWQEFLDGAYDVAAPLCNAPQHAITNHPAFKLALWGNALMQNGYSDLIFFTYAPLFASVGSWFAQLWAESLGKEGKGSMPVPALGVTDQHSIQQLFLDGPKNKGCIFITAPHLDAGQVFSGDLPPEYAYLEGKKFGDLLQAEALGTRMALISREMPLVHIALASTTEKDCAKLMSLLMLATYFTGKLMGINPLDQPAVELGKRLAKAQLGAAGLDRECAELAAFLEKERCAVPEKF